MKKFTGITIIVFIVFGLSCLTEAALIGSFNLGGSGEVTPSDAYDADAVYFFLTGQPKIFDSLTVSATDIGTEFFATSSSGSNPDPGFNAFVSTLTDGTDQRLFLQLTSGIGYYESILFGTSPDFQGYAIDTFGLILNNLTIGPPKDSIYRDWSWDMTFNVYGSQSVPEPATMLLLGSGLIGLVGFRRKFKN